MTSRHEIPDDDRVAALRLDNGEHLPSGLLCRSIGYRGTPAPGLPYDDHCHILPTARAGRLHRRSDRAWTTGVIGTNDACAAEPVESQPADHAAGLLGRRPKPISDMNSLVAQHFPRRVDRPMSQRPDEQERSAGRRTGRTRVKMTSIADMLRVAGQASIGNFP